MAFFAFNLLFALCNSSFNVVNLYLYYCRFFSSKCSLFLNLCFILKMIDIVFVLFCLTHHTFISFSYSILFLLFLVSPASISALFLAFLCDIRSRNQ